MLEVYKLQSEVQEIKNSNIELYETKMDSM